MHGKIEWIPTLLDREECWEIHTVRDTVPRLSDPAWRAELRYIQAPSARIPYLYAY